MPDYYKILGIDKTASPEEVKKAYRKLAHQHHPDKDGGNEEKFKEINEAYQILSDDQKRAQYNQFGSTFEDGNPFGGFSSGGWQFNMDDLGGFGDIFETFFGGQGFRQTRTRTRRGHDIAIDIEITFVESAVGRQKDIKHRVFVPCTHCHGNGAEPGTPIETCAQCHGPGAVNSTRRTPFGIFTQRVICPTCQGEGKTVKTPCLVCRGEGRERQERTLTVEIPAGIADGQTVRIAGRGEAPPRGGAAGDLLVSVHVQPHLTMYRDGGHVRSNVDVSFIDATLGTTVTVATLAGDRTLEIPSGTQPSTEFRFEKRGFPQLGGSQRGDHIVTVDIVIPRRLSHKQRQLLEEFRSQKKRRFF